MDEPGRILLVEDNQDLNRINARALALNGYEVRCARTLAQARELLDQADVDVILLDVMLPDGDGIDFLAQIRRRTDAHVLLLTSKTGPEHKLRGLNSGGDDYITKPYLLAELLARVGAAMRRRRLGGQPQPPLLARGPLTIDPLHQRALVSGAELPLTRTEYLLLLTLMRSAAPISARALYEAIWKQPLVGDPGVLWTHISRLKRKLESADPCILLTTSRQDGYKIEVI